MKLKTLLFALLLSLLHYIAFADVINCDVNGCSVNGIPVATYKLPINDGDYLVYDATTHQFISAGPTSGSGDVTGPGSSTLNHVPQFAGTTGKVLKDGLAIASASTASALVQRDSSGDFAAHIITAALAGNASTATALAANGTNCTGTDFAKGVDASGNAEGCATPAGGGGGSAGFDAITTGTNTTATMTIGTGGHIAVTGSGTNAATTAPFSGITSSTNTTGAMVVGSGASLSTTGTGTIVATALSADGTNCSAGQFAAGIDASGNAQGCATPAGGGTVTVSGSPATNVIPKFDSSGTNLVASIITCDSTSCSFGDTSTNDVTLTFINLSAGHKTLTVDAANNTVVVVPKDCNALNAGDVIKSVDANGAIACLTPAGGGSSAFSALTASTNTTAAMVVGSGASLATTGTGTIAATTATALAANGTNCTVSGEFPKGIDASGNAENCTAAGGSGLTTLGARVHNTATISVSADTQTILTFDTEDRDDGNIHSTSSNTGLITVPTGGSGWWSISAGADWTSAGIGKDKYLTIRVNSTEICRVVTQLITVSTSVPEQNCSTLWYAADGDTFSAYVYSASETDTIAVDANRSPVFSAVRISQ